MSTSSSFSPVAGIQWVETISTKKDGFFSIVSVPLPGFSGLRQDSPCINRLRSMVSVPLPGFSGLRLFYKTSEVM